MLKLQRISLGDVQEFRWRLWPRGGSAVLKNSGTRLVINWAEYEWAIVEPVLRWLRQSIPLNKQHGWELFAYQHLIPIELKFPAAASRQVTLTRRTWAKWFLPGAVLCFFAGIAVEVTRGTHQYWVGPMPILLLWLSLHFMTPREGIKTVRLSDSPVPDVAMVKPLALITVLSLSALTAIGVGVKLYPEYETEGLIAMYVVAAIVLTAIFCWSFQIDRAQRRIWEARGKELVPQWEREWLAAGTCASAKRL